MNEYRLKKQDIKGTTTFYHVHQHQVNLHTPVCVNPCEQNYVMV